MNSERKAQLKAIMEQYKALGTFYIKSHQQISLGSTVEVIILVLGWMVGFKRTLALKKKVNEAKSSPSQRVGNTKNLSDKAGGTHEKHN